MATPEARETAIAVGEGPSGNATANADGAAINGSALLYAIAVTGRGAKNGNSSLNNN